MRYDLGYIDLEARTPQPLDNPLGPRLLPMPWVRFAAYVSGLDNGQVAHPTGVPLSSKVNILRGGGGNSLQHNSVGLSATVSHLALLQLRSSGWPAWRYRHVVTADSRAVNNSASVIEGQIVAFIKQV
jgi:hypothetical protein